MTPSAQWSPVRAVFLRRVGIVAAVTFVVSVAVLLLVSEQMRDAPLLAVGLGAIAALTGVFEDILRWWRVRLEQWTLDDDHLIHTTPDTRAQIPLGDITRARRQTSGTVMLQLISGQRIAMRYMADPNAVIEAVHITRAADV